ncbi:multi antimicrobial extrusion family protein [Cavenderia fasciculata]|uniref:Multi antimicrobial extrusion family protein n=1 Tax=Cavenderia fasciculata TaxID=261658 RepID=F4PPB7_CACFS|nr:multi antimicrobial extrusion family protein [Cavenderia fasciculata]EGG22230.1 multi antimicrobial extrusion family protein [Cavenderia fasciculata]|eukprot:XP_004360081.1 multi antimicrobial extrusion family protein [Cavenderia fasciculata]
MTLPKSISQLDVEALAKEKYHNVKNTLKDSKEEIIFLLEWIWPVLIANILNNVAYLFVNMAFAGRLGKDELAAVALGNTWQFSTSAIAIGTLNAMDTLISQSYGAKNYQLIGVTVQRAAIISIIYCFFISILWIFTYPIMVAMHQDQHVALLTQQYTTYMLPGLWLGTLLTILEKYLQAQGIMKSSIVVGVILNIANAIFNFIFVHGVRGDGGMGVIGCSLATSLSKTISFFALLGWIYFFKLHERPVKTWYGFSRQALSISGLKEYLHLGVPAGLQMVFEGCGFEILTILAGKSNQTQTQPNTRLLGPTSLDAHSIAMNFTLMTFMIPLSLSIALSVRIGQLLGARQPQMAKRTTRIGFGISIVFMMVVSSTQFFSRHFIGSIYSSDIEVRQMVAKLLPISALFQIFDGFQTTCQGIIRGVGKNKIGAVINFTAFYLVGLPISSVLTFVVMHKVYGLWIGLSCGLAACAIILGIVVNRIDWNAEMERALARTAADGAGGLMDEEETLGLEKDKQDKEDQEQGDSQTNSEDISIDGAEMETIKRKEKEKKKKQQHHKKEEKIGLMNEQDGDRSSSNSNSDSDEDEQDDDDDDQSTTRTIPSSSIVLNHNHHSDTIDNDI